MRASAEAPAPAWFLAGPDEVVECAVEVGPDGVSARVGDHKCSLGDVVNLAAKKTWRYLRLAMVAMVVGLAASVLHATASSCWQESISAYYYTPAQGFLVGAIVTIGVCLFALKGNSDPEDLLLNLAGVCAPFVALVPTPAIGDCGTVYDGRNRAGNIANNVFALLVVLTLAVAAVAVLELLNRTRRPEERLSALEWWGVGTGTVALAAVWIIFYTAREWFALNMHNIAAIAMFVFIWLTVLLNARNLRGRQTRRQRRSRVVYLAIAVLMAVVAVANGIAGVAGWPYAVISVEAELIVLFAVFWTTQTIELWDDGLRPLGQPAARNG